MIVLFTDFGIAGPYIGQMKAVLHRHAPRIPIIGLVADAPTCNPRAAAYLLAALAPEFPEGTVFLAVVDPGVGGARAACLLEADGRRYVGPENGLFEIVARQAATPARWWEIMWRPERLSDSFHGRDLFAPVAGMLACGETPEALARPLSAAPRPDWPDDLAEIIYIDGFGNAMTGLRVRTLPATATLEAGGVRLARVRTFSERPAGEAFWYGNANGLAEIAVNRGRADRDLGLSVGSPVSVVLQEKQAAKKHGKSHII